MNAPGVPTDLAPQDLPELGFYALRGYLNDPSPIIAEVEDAESIGIGSVWIAERFDIKNVGVLCGAVAARTQRLGIATGVTNPNTRSLPVLASMGATLSTLSHGRFTIGFGRAFSWQWSRWGLPDVTTSMLVETADLLRRLWRGERVSGINPSTGLPLDAALGMPIDDPPPLVLAALGPKTQRIAGAYFDGVLLHPFWTDEAICQAVDRVRRGAEEAGRDPDAVSIWSCLVLAADGDEDRELEAGARRLTTYLQLPEYGELIARSNGWDPAVLDRLRRDPVLAGRIADTAQFTRDDLRRLADIYPPSWLEEAAALGPAAKCAARLVDQLEAGANGVLIHASSPGQLSDTIAAYRTVRPAQRFRGWSTRPCSPARPTEAAP